MVRIVRKAPPRNLSARIEKLEDQLKRMSHEIGEISNRIVTESRRGEYVIHPNDKRVTKIIIQYQ
jgi:hypothetical protein